MFFARVVVDFGGVELRKGAQIPASKKTATTTATTTTTTTTKKGVDWTLSINARSTNSVEISAGTSFVKLDRA